MSNRKPGRRRGLTRREFIGGVAATAGAFMLPGCHGSSRRSSNAGLPNPASSGFDHVVVVMMENRSFDHYLGWVPGADGIQAGEPLGARASSISIAHALDFSSAPNVSTPAFNVPAGPFGVTCVPVTGILDLAGVALPAPVPVPAGTPLPILFSFPPVPGLDVPLPSSPSAAASRANYKWIAYETARRRADHEGELELLRRQSRRHGFA